MDTTRVFRDAYARASRDAGLSNAARAEVDAEFDDDDLDAGIDDVVVGA